MILALALGVAAVLASPHGRDGSLRDDWLRSISRGSVPQNSSWPPLTKVELEQFEDKARGWYEHAVRTGPGGHIQWGQAMPQVIYADANMTVRSGNLSSCNLVLYSLWA